MNFRNLNELNDDITGWIQKLPGNIELVVGIPRSGLLVANLLSLHLNIPMTDLDGFLEGRILSAGGRLKEFDKEDFLKTPRSILVVDDSICSGREIEKAKHRIATIQQSHKVIFAAVYAATQEQMQKYKDSYLHLSMPRFFEWNVLHHSVLENSCVDIDGVLCPDPSETENDDGSLYRAFIRTVKPIRVPTVPIGYLVTCRLEKYRQETIDWLKENSISYNKLFMMDYPDKRSRQEDNRYSFYKAKIYTSTHADLFIESSQVRSEEIARISGKYVYCINSHILINPSISNRVKEKIREEFNKTRSHPIYRIKGLFKILKAWIKKN